MTWIIGDTAHLIANVSRICTLYVAASLLALCCVTGAVASPLLIGVTQTITPTQPSFGDSLFSGFSVFQTGYLDQSGFVSDGSFGPTKFSALPWKQAPGPPTVPPISLLKGDMLVWQFGGTLGNGLGGSFVTFAMPPGPPTFPPGPPVSPPLIMLAFDLQDGFAPFDISGAIVAWDSPEQVGTWDIHLQEADAVPEPSTLLLFVAGLGTLVFVARRKVLAG